MNTPYITIKVARETSPGGAIDYYYEVVLIIGKLTAYLVGWKDWPGGSIGFIRAVQNTWRNLAKENGVDYREFDYDAWEKEEQERIIIERRNDGWGDYDG